MIGSQSPGAVRAYALLTNRGHYPVNSADGLGLQREATWWFRQRPKVQETFEGLVTDSTPLTKAADALAAACQIEGVEVPR